MSKAVSPLDSFKLYFEEVPNAGKRLKKIKTVKPSFTERVKAWLLNVKENLESRNLI